MSLGEWFRKYFPLEPLWADEYRATHRERIKRQPTLTLVRHAPAREEFKAWRDDPTALFAFAALRQAAEAQQQLWLEKTWGSGIADQNFLTELRARADAYEAIEAATYEAFCEWVGVEPEPLPDEAA